MEQRFALTDHVIKLAIDPTSSTLAFAVIDIKSNPINEVVYFTNAVIIVESGDYVLNPEVFPEFGSEDTELPMGYVNYFVIEAAAGIGVVDIRDTSQKTHTWNLLSHGIELMLVEDKIKVKSVSKSSPDYQVVEIGTKS